MFNLPNSPGAPGSLTLTQGLEKFIKWSCKYYPRSPGIQKEMQLPKTFETLFWRRVYMYIEKSNKYESFKCLRKPPKSNFDVFHTHSFLNGKYSFLQKPIFEFYNVVLNCTNIF